ncbi:MAG: aminodeoxychorismate synthase component I [Legionellales bacterium]|nr:aminodeoxychorismate synthase component I [Legionellales bacterium]
MYNPINNKYSFPLIKKVNYINPVHVLLSLQEVNNLCFLDSAKKHIEQGRYSFLGIDPFATYSIKQGKVLSARDQIGENPFHELKKMIKPFQQAIKDNNNKNLPPFTGGAMGYFAYELLHYLENIPYPAFDKLDVPDMTMGFYDCVIVWDHFEKEVWIFSHGFPELEMTKRYKRALARMQWLENILYLAKNKEMHHRASWWFNNENKITSNFSKSSYLNNVKKIIEHIHAGDIFQANFTQLFSGKLPRGVSAFDLFLITREKNPAPFSAWLNFDKVQIVSASPERFLKLDHGMVETRPIKGTKPRGNNLQHDNLLRIALSQSEKDRAENIMIVDLMRNDLSRVCEPDSVRVEKLCEVESYETVHHLVSSIIGKLHPQFDAIDLLMATFPGGSITGAPKVKAMEIISRLEQHTRGVYCGSIGYIGFNGNMDTSISIRTYTLKSENVWFQAGGGIVADSSCLDEYEESLTKSKILKTILQGQLSGNDHDPVN